MLDSFNGLGRLTSDPKLKSIDTKNGKTDLVNFTIAIDRNHKNSDGNYSADFVRCTAWNQSARYLNKYGHRGGLTYVSGRLETRMAKDKDDPNKHRYFSGIRVSQLGLINTQKSSHQNSSSNNSDESSNKSNSDSNDISNDLPF